MSKISTHTLEFVVSFHNSFPNIYQMEDQMLWETFNKVSTRRQN